MTEPPSIRYNSLSLERLKEVLDYDSQTGVFVWRVELGWRGKVGQQAGSRDARGYIRIMVDRRLYLAHRLAWFYVTGQWPIDQIDHRDCDKSNNGFSNLREATNSQNNQNRRKQTGGTSKFKGVSWHIQDRMWESRIKRNGRQIFLGLYKTEEEAHAAYRKAASEMFGVYARAA